MSSSIIVAIENSMPAGRLVLGSSGSVYGGAASIPALETDRCEPLDQYAVSKLAAEHFAGVSARRAGFSLAIARIFNVVGPGLDERHLAAHLARQFAEQSTLAEPEKIVVGPLTSTRDYIDVRDVADGLATLIISNSQLFSPSYSSDKKAEGVFNLASGVELKTQLIYDKLACLGRHTALAIDRQQARLLDIDRAYADISRLHALGFTPAHSLDDSLTALFDYYVREVSEENQA